MEVCYKKNCSEKFGLRPATSLKKEVLAQVLCCECWNVGICESFKKNFFTGHLQATAFVDKPGLLIGDV